MNWEALGAIAELLGAIGVIASLIYLALQIRQNTRVARAEITKDLYLASRTAIMDMAADDRLGKIWTHIRRFPDEEVARRYAFYQSFFRLYELQHNLSGQDLLDESIARSYQLIIRMFVQTPDFPPYWEKARDEFNEGFRDYVQAQIDAVSSGD